MFGLGTQGKFIRVETVLIERKRAPDYHALVVHEIERKFHTPTIRI